MPMHKKSVNKPRPSDKRVRSIVKKELKKNSEIHYHDRTLVNTSVDYSGTSFFSLSGISQGDTDITRTGDQVIPRFLQIRGSVVAGDGTNLVRVMVVQYKYNANDDPADIDQLLSATYKATVGYPLAPYNHDYRGKAFAVLADKLFTVDTYNPIRQFNIKLKRIAKIAYPAGGTTALKNSLYLVACSDSAAATHPTVLATCRLWFSP